MSGPLRLLLLTDGKPGHAAQLRGLAEAVGRRTDVEVRWHDVADGGRADFAADWVVGAGRRTHWQLLTESRRRGARSVVLMNPSLPRWLFDVCVVPRHDGVRGGNVVETVGVLNDVTADNVGDRRGGVVLIGGPSKHHGWDADDLFASLNDVLRSSREESWRITSSRRTPDATLTRLHRRFAGDRRVRYIPHTQTPTGWVREQLSQCRAAVVTEDSVSMLTEAMTAGCRTVALPVPRRREGRVTRFVDDCLREGRLVRSASESVVTRPLWEADRVAGLLLERFVARRAA